MRVRYHEGMFDWNQDPHRRYNPLTREWVLVSPHRTQRPWQGQVEKSAAQQQPDYDPECYLCPGNARAGGARNPNYKSTFVFENDFAALKPDTRLERFEQDGLLVAETEPGVCRVVCFSPRHNLTIANMAVEDLRLVVDAWVEQFTELGAMPFINYVQIFENRGPMMGASNPHPHCQIWSNHAIPNEVSKEQAAQLGWKAERGECLLCAYTRLELEARTRVVEENADFVTVVPFWAIWPFETMVLAKRHLKAIDQLTEGERNGLADILKRTTARYDRLFQVSFPYSMGFHQRPTDGEAHDEWHLHLHFDPPLLRSATVRKFLVGYELLATPQRDITPEQAAERLRAV
jgi:UDPglucose--hexose-1-phosphate uridylyltransferase